MGTLNFAGGASLSGSGTNLQSSSGLNFSGSWVDAPPGTIIQVTQKDITSTASTNSNESHSIISTLDSPITTLLTGSKILIMSSIAGYNNQAGGDMSWKIYRSISGTNTEIDLNPSPIGSTTTGIFPNMRGYGGGAGFTYYGIRWDYKYLDTHGQSAGTTITYRFAVRTEASNSWVMNSSPQTSDGRFTTTVSHVILMEVAQ